MLFLSRAFCTKISDSIRNFEFLALIRFPEKGCRGVGCGHRIKLTDMSWLASKFFAAVAVVALAVGCSSTPQKESALVASGFKIITPGTPAQLTKLKTLKPFKFLVVQKKGTNYCIFPDPAHNRAYVGGQIEHQDYMDLCAQQKIAKEKMEAAEMNQKTTMDWGAWHGWGMWARGFAYCD